MGNSRAIPDPATESRFVADEGDGFDVAHRLVSSGAVVSVFLKTTRVVGTVDPNGLLTGGGLLHPDQGTLARTLVLNIRAEIAGRLRGTLGSGLNVEVFLHRGITGPGLPVDFLEGAFGPGWQDFRLEVPALNVRWPADPCPGQDPKESCGLKPVARPNEISFVFTGDPEVFSSGVTFEIDWMTLEPRVEADAEVDEPGLAWRPVLLAHGWRGRTFTWTDDGWAWGDGLRTRDIGFHAPELNRYGTIRDNGPQITAAVDDLKNRFGVERVNVVGHCKGGLDAREHVRRHDDVDTLIMLATPNLGSFEMEEATSPESLPGLVSTAEADPKQVARSALELTSLRMSRYNRTRKENPRTVYVAAAVDHNSPYATSKRQSRGANDESVSVASVHALSYAAQEQYDTSENDPENQTCLSSRIGPHLCLLTYGPRSDRPRSDPDIFGDLFDKYLDKLTPPRSGPSSTDGPAGLARENVADAAAGPAVEDVAAVVQGVGSDVALIPADGVTQAHAVLIDAADAAQFEAIVSGDLVRLELVSPSGGRIDAATPLTDPAVIHAPLLDQGPFSVTGYYIQAPEPGTWTLEVTGTGVPEPDTGYAVTALVQLPAGSGVVLAAAVDLDQGVVGDPVTITATVTADGLPVTGAAVRAEVFPPDGDTTTEVVLVDDGTGGDAVAGDGVYTGVFAATTLTGDYAVVVSVEGPASAFTREQQLDFAVVPSASSFSGSFSDRGVDTDGDGRFDQLVIDVGLEVDVEAAYRVFGTLSDGAGTAIEQVRVEQQLAPGPQTVALAFDGAALFALGHDGPYLLEDLVVEDVATLTGLAVGPTYTTAAYAHTDFQRPPLLLTGNTSDHGAHTVHMERLPFEELVVEVEVDTMVAVEAEAAAKLYAEDGTFVAVANTASSLEPGLVMVEFRFRAGQIFQAGKPGPYTVQLFSIWGTSTDGTAVSLQAPGVVADTQPYRLEDFAPSPGFTVGGTLTGMIGSRQVELELATEGPPGTPPITTLRPRNGQFTFFLSPRLVSGNSYQVRVTQQPTDPVQVCTVTNASGTIEDANVTNVEVHCV